MPLGVNRILSLEEADEEFTSQVAIKFQQGLHTEHDMARVREVLQHHPGKAEVVVLVDTRDEQDPEIRRRYVLSTPQDLRVSCSKEFRAELGHVLGEEYFRFHPAPKKPNGRQRVSEYRT